MPTRLSSSSCSPTGGFPAALSGKIDFGLCSTTITPDRAIRIAFTYPYHRHRQRADRAQGRRYHEGRRS